jgi:hypothetical protein
VMTPENNGGKGSFPCLAGRKVFGFLSVLSFHCDEYI